uniref:DNA replication and repair protein RecF n=1 Tax=Prochlorococcus marinus str. P0903-H212 TaxID=1622208 RepID=A0A0D5A3T8_PROMR|nr:DNA recombination and repair protein RecF [Prochlorococcus marinus str. P0903-H212]
MIVIGENGVGKSNLLESVELLSSLRSHRSNRNQDLIYWDQDKACLSAMLEDDQKLALELNRKGGRKAYKNEKLLTRQIDLIGPMRSVGFSALDLDLIRGEPALRRNWLDRIVQQLEPIYSDLIGRFSRLLRQRSQLWRNLSVESNKDKNILLDSYDMQMALVSTRIHRRRRRILNRLLPMAASWQQHLSNSKEKLNIVYLPGSKLEGEESERCWRESIERQLLEIRLEEEITGNCRVGPHRDDVQFQVNGVDARRFASAGQQRTIVLALKLAELELIKKVYGQSPVLLLDDVLAELDPKRQLLLLDAVGQKHQCLISATHVDSFEGEWVRNSQLMQLDSLG